MQRCPKCNRTYQDDSQKFCTFDGGRLMVDAQAPTTFDLGPAPQTDPLGATVMGPAPDLNKTVAGTPPPPPSTTEIPPAAPTGPTNPPMPQWPSAPTVSAPPQPTPPAQSTGPTTTSPLGAPPSARNQPTAASSVPSAGLATPAAGIGQGPQTGGMVAPPSSGQLGFTPVVQKKSSKLPLILGVLAVIFLLVIGGGAAFYFFALKPKAETANNNAVNSNGPTLERDTGATTGINANTSNANASSAQPPVTQPPNSTRFINTREKLTGSLAEHFVDFSLYYPNNWTVDPKAGSSSSSNFFKADRTLSDDTGDYLLESAAISWYQSNGTMQLDRPIFPNRVEYFNNLFAKDYPNYQKVSEGETKVNGLDAYQFTFKGLVKGTGKGDISLWGRVIFLPLGDGNSRNGIVLLMLASSAAPEVKAIDDVGEKGELPTILKTFRIGAAQ